MMEPTYDQQTAEETSLLSSISPEQVPAVLKRVAYAGAPALDKNFYDALGLNGVFSTERAAVEQLVFKASAPEFKTNPLAAACARLAERRYLANPELNLQFPHYSARNVLTVSDSDRGITSSVLLLPEIVDGYGPAGYVIKAERPIGKGVRFYRTQELVTPTPNTTEPVDLDEILAMEFKPYVPRSYEYTHELRAPESRAQRAVTAYRQIVAQQTFV